jgi:hypothetical protein
MPTEQNYVPSITTAADAAKISRFMLSLQRGFESGQRSGLFLSSSAGLRLWTAAAWNDENAFQLD